MPPHPLWGGEREPLRHRAGDDVVAVEGEVPLGFGHAIAASVVANWVSTIEPARTQSGTCAIQPCSRPIRKSGATRSGASSDGFHRGARLGWFTVTHRPFGTPS